MSKSKRRRSKGSNLVIKKRALRYAFNRLCEKERVKYTSFLHQINDGANIGGVLSLKLKDIDDEHVVVDVYEMDREPYEVILRWNEERPISRDLRVKADRLENQGDGSLKKCYIRYNSKAKEPILKVDFTRVKQPWKIPKNGKLDCSSLGLKNFSLDTLVEYGAIRQAPQLLHEKLRDGTELAYAWFTFRRETISLYFVKEKDKYQLVASADESGRLVPPNSNGIFNVWEPIQGLTYLEFARALHFNATEFIPSFESVPSRAPNNKRAEESWKIVRKYGDKIEKPYGETQLMNAVINPEVCRIKMIRYGR